jgi:hypothetical protein
MELAILAAQFAISVLVLIWLTTNSTAIWPHFVRRRG